MDSKIIFFWGGARGSAIRNKEGSSSSHDPRFSRNAASRNTWDRHALGVPNFSREAAHLRERLICKK
jgi:hypothetical protein